jgi:hypothetical protein
LQCFEQKNAKILENIFAENIFKIITSGGAAVAQR